MLNQKFLEEEAKAANLQSENELLFKGLEQVE